MVKPEVHTLDRVWHYTHDKVLYFQSRQMSHVYLNVRYSQKDVVKQLGARWDAVAKKWYVPKGIALAPFVDWLPAPAITDDSEPKLTVELVPRTCWYSNVRSHISKDNWKKIGRQIFQRAGYRCEVCGGRGNKHPVECHEIWHYDDKNCTQTLVGLTALCPACHECKHMGFANTQGRGEIALTHLAEVNGWSLDWARSYTDRCFEVWAERSQFEWKIDLDYLRQFDIQP
ncbi:MAG: hypothetical protein N4J56_007404 [Chroococcidiopsis sp. SAG 2025]|nr:hypothetical protein [Chroococcidiopsis sp. SAG 2025]